MHWVDFAYGSSKLNKKIKWAELLLHKKSWKIMTSCIRIICTNLDNSNFLQLFEWHFS